MAPGPKELFKESPRVTGTVERITFQSAETGFCVLRVRDEKGAKITVVGNATELNEGMMIDASGTWVMDPKFGRQLKADQMRISQPATLEGMQKYLGSGLVPGIGPAFAERLIDAFGPEVFEVIENEPDRLLEVEGIGRGRHKKILAAWGDQKIVREIMVFLQGHGVSTGLAFRIFKQYGSESMEKVAADPYTLARDLRGVGFVSADKIAQNLGFGKESPARVAAGVEHTLQEISREGHTAYPRDELLERAGQLLEVGLEFVVTAVDSGLSSGRLVELDSEDQLALKIQYTAENELANDLLRLASAGLSKQIQDPDKAISWVEKETGLQLAATQKEAVKLALANRVLVITGGPGVGKTTLLNSILKIQKTRKLKIVACAPTGRAARRLSESTGLEATTIHRLMDFNPGTGSFRHNRDNPLTGELFVIDEFSMVDAQLAWQLVRAMPANASLLLVGDVDQLPSVGPGRVLGDIIDSGSLPVARLHEVFRQASSSAIITNAHRINDGHIPLDGDRGQDSTLEDFYFIERQEPQAIADLVVDLVARRLPGKLSVDPIEDIQVLTPMKRGELGTINLNHRLQSILNPTGNSVMRQGVTWRVGDKVMQTVNNYDKDVFNGDIGVIESVDAQQEELLVRFDRQVVDYDLRDLDELMHSFAVSIHKSQGSEFPVVVIPLHTQHYMLLQRNLLYTGVTRGRRLVVLVGSRMAVQTAVRRVESRQRVTMLKKFLQKKIN